MTDIIETGGRLGADPAAENPTPAPGRSSSWLAAALAELQKDLPKIRKSETANVKTDKANYSYTYADLSAISDQVLPRMGALGLSFIAKPTFIDGRFVLAYSLLHTSGEREDGEYPLPTNTTPQAIGSAITYGRRYCLCAVTGVAPDDDDDAAAAQQEQQRRQSTPPPAVVEAVNDVGAAWRVTYGQWDEHAAAQLFARWSGGEVMREAPASRLKKFAAYLLDMPKSEAGGNPDDAPTSQPEDDAGPRPLTGLQRSRIFAELNSRGIRDAAEQRTYIGEVIGRPIESRTEITFADAQQLIDHFEMLGRPPSRDESEDGAS